MDKVPRLPSVANMARLRAMARHLKAARVPDWRREGILERFAREAELPPAVVRDVLGLDETPTAFLLEIA